MENKIATSTVLSLTDIKTPYGLTQEATLSKNGKLTIRVPFYAPVKGCNVAFLAFLEVVIIHHNKSNCHEDIGLNKSLISIRCYIPDYWTQLGVKCTKSEMSDDINLANASFYADVDAIDPLFTLSSIVRLHKNNVRYAGNTGYTRNFDLSDKYCPMCNIRKNFKGTIFFNIIESMLKLCPTTHGKFEEVFKWVKRGRSIKVPQISSIYIDRERVIQHLRDFRETPNKGYYDYTSAVVFTKDRIDFDKTIEEYLQLLKNDSERTKNLDLIFSVLCEDKNELKNAAQDLFEF